MQLLLGTIPCLDVETERANLAALGLPAPPEFDRANTIFNPLGEQPARGWLLVTREDLDALDLNALHDVVFIDTDDQDQEVRKLTLKSMVIVNAVCVTPNVVGQVDAAYLVEVADKRHLVANPLFCKPANVSYNVRAPGWGGSYYTSTTNGGTAWTWATLVEDLWSDVSAQLGTFPGLPFTPHGTPEGWKFPGVPAWAALCAVLRRIGCAVRWKVSSDLDTKATVETYAIVRLGADDDAEFPLDIISVAEDEGRLLLDRDVREPVKGKVPYGVRVFFHRLEQHRGTEKETAKDSTQWSSNTPISYDVTGPDSANAEAGVYHPLWDDLPAIYDATGMLTNNSALNTRAQERADDFYRRLRDPGGSRLHKVFSGLVLVGPASVISGVRWGQVQPYGGLATEIVRVPGGEIAVDGMGGWKEGERSLPNQAPDFGPTWPNYPDLAQIVRVTGSLYLNIGGTIYADARVVHRNSDTGAFTDAETVWLVGLADSPEPPVGHYLARLSSYEAGRPVYLASQSSSTGSSACVSGARVRLLQNYTDPAAVVHWAMDTADTFDSGGYFDPAYPTRLTIPSDGVYEIGVIANWLMNGGFANSNGIEVLIAKNGHTPGPLNADWRVAWDSHFLATGTVIIGTDLMQQAEAKLVCRAGDYFEVEAGGSDGNVLARGFALYGTNFYIVRLGDACGAEQGSGSGNGSGIGGACGNCTGVTPTVWTGTGTDFVGDCTSFNGAWTFAHDPNAPCLWIHETVSGGHTYTINLYAQSGGVLEAFFFIDTLLVATYRKTGWDSNCCTAQTLDKISSTCSNQATITLTPVC